MTDELPRLRARLDFLGKVVDEIAVEFTQVKGRLSAAKIERESTRQKIEKAERLAAQANKPLEIKVSDHAVLRYMERVLNLNIESVRGSILTERNKKMIQFARDCRIKQDGVELVVRGGVVTTVIAEGEDENG